MARFLIWQFGKFGKDRQIKNSPIRIIAMRVYGANNSDRQIKIRQYLLRANSPNLMLTKFFHYTVYLGGMTPWQ